MSEIHPPDRSVLQNRWRGGVQQWAVTLPESAPRGEMAIVPARTTLDHEVGEEVVLCIIDPTPFIHDIAALRPFTLHVNAGIAQTAAGLMLFVLLYLQPPGMSEPYAVFEWTLNPSDPSHLAPVWDLTLQTHWHVFVLGHDDEVLGIFEMENVYRLRAALELAVEACTEYPNIDFDAVKREFTQSYSLRELLEMEV